MNELFEKKGRQVEAASDFQQKDNESEIIKACTPVLTFLAT